MEWILIVRNVIFFFVNVPKLNVDGSLQCNPQDNSVHFQTEHGLLLCCLITHQSMGKVYENMHATVAVYIGPSNASSFNSKYEMIS